MIVEKIESADSGSDSVLEFHCVGEKFVQRYSTHRPVEVGQVYTLPVMRGDSPFWDNANKMAFRNVGPFLDIEPSVSTIVDTECYIMIPTALAMSIGFGSSAGFYKNSISSFGAIDTKRQVPNQPLHRVWWPGDRTTSIPDMYIGRVPSLLWSSPSFTTSMGTKRFCKPLLSNSYYLPGDPSTQSGAVFLEHIEVVGCYISPEIWYSYELGTDIAYKYEKGKTPKIIFGYKALTESIERE